MRVVNRKSAIAICLLLFWAALWPLAAWGAPAAEGISASQELSAFNVVQLTEAYSFSLRLANQGSATYRGITAAVGKAKGFENGVFIPGAEAIGPKGENTYFFTVDISREAGPGAVDLPVTFYYDNNGKRETLIETRALFNVGRLISSVAGYDAVILDMAYTLENPEGFKAGATNVLTLVVTNRGNSVVQDVRVALTLPETMTIDNSSGSQYAGNLGIGEGKAVRFNVFVDKKTANKNHPVTVNMAGLGKSGAATSQQVVYIPVTGGEEKEEDSRPLSLQINGVGAPAQVPAGNEFTLCFNVWNDGEKDAENVKVEATSEPGAANKTANVFMEPKLAAGALKTYYITFLTDKTNGGKSIPLKMSVTSGTGDKAFSISQYANVYLEKLATEGGVSVKTPQLIVDGYSYGGGNVNAGKDFPLSVSFLNTSTKTVTNVKITLASDGGAFIPVGSSNSIYIAEIPAGDRVSRTLTMTVSPSAEQKTTPINVSMAYEDKDGGQFQGADVISIPVVQVTRLTVDDVVGQPMNYVGVPTGVEAKFYNTGKTALQNLRVAVEGNFDTAEGGSYYAGNMNSGASDSCTFTVIPREEGEMAGKLVFSFDDPSGNRVTQEKEFALAVGAMQMEGGPEMAVDETPPKDYTKFYVGGGAAALAIIIFMVVLSGILKRRRMHRELEMED
ncbi:MAG: hypothetical protein LBG71_02560 [Clostridiales Family XIII bacterium]|jgi:hypothetical protein|nr:hypothetical protein [Clostridiales Family XIII bacterium]